LTHIPAAGATPFANHVSNYVIAAVQKMKPTVGMLNPPYSQSKSDAELHELYFVKQMLDTLSPGGIGIAIVPMSCAISPNPMREELMKHHSLDAVMSMPQELFYPVGTVTCVMVWIAGVPHEQMSRKTWFGYWRDDGFVKTKHKGRIEPRRDCRRPHFLRNWGHHDETGTTEIFS